jgi:hypothetical protein
MVAVRLPKQYRPMTYEEFIAAGKKALKQLQDRLEIRRVVCSVDGASRRLRHQCGESGRNCTLL